MNPSSFFSESVVRSAAPYGGLRRTSNLQGPLRIDRSRLFITDEEDTVRTLRIALVLLASLAFGGLATAASEEAPELVPIATYDTGLGANGSEIISIRHTDGIAVLTNVAGSVDVLDLSNPAEPRRLRRVAVDTSNGTPNSAAVHPHHDYFLVVIGKSGVTGTVAAYRLSTGAFLGSAPVGIQPDSIAIAPNGQYAVVANEAEGFAVGNDGGPG